MVAILVFTFSVGKVIAADMMPGSSDVKILLENDELKFLIKTGFKKPWMFKRDQLSQAYTTRWDKLPIAKASFPLSC